MDPRALIPFTLLLGPLVVCGQANDSCSAAVTLPVNATCMPVGEDLVDATESMPAATCNNSVSAGASDLWYNFMATTSQTTVEVTGGPDIDPIIEVFEGTCDSLVSLGCDDQTFFGGTEVVTIATIPGNTYFARVYYWVYASPPLSFNFEICAYEGSIPPPPINDQCADVTPELLSPGSPLTFMGTTVNATSTNDYGPGSSWNSVGSSVWHAFTLDTCAHVIVSYCGTDPEFSNVWLLLMTNCPADSGLYTSGWDVTTCGDDNVTVGFDPVAAGTYYLPVLSDPLHAYGPYTIEVSATDCPVGVNEMAGVLELFLYPVPNDGDFTLSGTWNGPVEVDVVDPWGRVCLRQTEILGGNMPFTVRGRGRLAPGAYVVRVTGQGGNSVSHHMVVR